MMRVLVLDGNQRSALAATRALGRQGIPVVVAGETRKTLAGSSRYRSDGFVYPSPYEHPEHFIATIRAEAAARNVRVILPMTDLTTLLVLRHREQFADTVIPWPSLDAFETLTDKRSLVRLAQVLGLPTPATCFARGPEKLAGLLAGFTFPVVLKPYRSILWSGGRWLAASVHYATSLRQAQDIVASHEYFVHQPFLIQAYVRGEARGVFALYDSGRPAVFFAHRRLREKPPSGGVSVLSESVAVDSHLRAVAQRILDHVKWHGVAMVEFKVAADGTPYLMEVNARLWGSLQLAIDAGIDFPYLLYRLAAGEGIGPVDGYRLGVRTRWLLGDLDHLYRTLKGSSGPDGPGPSRWQTVVRFLNLFAQNTRYEINRWDDFRPFLFELGQYVRNRG